MSKVEKTYPQLIEEKKMEIMEHFTPEKKEIIVKSKEILKEKLDEKTIDDRGISLLLQLIDFEQKIVEWEELKKIPVPKEK